MAMKIPINCHLSEITELKYTSLIEIQISNVTQRLLHLNSSNTFFLVTIDLLCIGKSSGFGIT